MNTTGKLAVAFGASAAAAMMLLSAAWFAGAHAKVKTASRNQAALTVGQSDEGTLQLHLAHSKEGTSLFTEREVWSAWLLQNGRPRPLRGPQAELAIARLAEAAESPAFREFAPLQASSLRTVERRRPLPALANRTIRGLPESLLFFGVIAGMIATLTLRRRRFAPGSCPACGYDLHGAPTPTCPECGA